MLHCYPHNLVEILIDKWNAGQSGFNASSAGPDIKCDKLPNCDVLDELVSTCYQTSIMAEEERSLRFRLILIDPERLSAEDGPPDSLHRLIFCEPRAFNEYELRKLAPAVDFYGSLIGVKMNAVGEPQIWGILHSGQRWIQAIRGGSLGYSPLPPSLVLYVVRSGHIVVCRGSEMIAMLSDGKLLTPSKSVLNSRWFRESLGEGTIDLWNLHDAARSKANKPWAFLERNFPDLLGRQIIKRIISIVRNSHHGGTLISLSSERRHEVCSPNNYLNIKYLFKEEEPRNRFHSLLLKI